MCPWFTVGSFSPSHSPMPHYLTVDQIFFVFLLLMPAIVPYICVDVWGGEESKQCKMVTYFPF